MIWNKKEKEKMKNQATSLLHHVGAVSQWLTTIAIFPPTGLLQLSEPLKWSNPPPLLNTHEQRRLPRTQPPLYLEASPWDTEAPRRSRGGQKKSKQQGAGSHGVPPSQAHHAFLQAAPEPPPQAPARPSGPRQDPRRRLRRGAGRGTGPPQSPTPAQRLPAGRCPVGQVHGDQEPGQGRRGPAKVGFLPQSWDGGANAARRPARRLLPGTQLRYLSVSKRRPAFFGVAISVNFGLGLWQSINMLVVWSGFACLVIIDHGEIHLLLAIARYFELIKVKRRNCAGIGHSVT